MGREIRRVPADWEHPVKSDKVDLRYGPDYQPLYDEDFESAMDEWLSEGYRWLEGEAKYQHATDARTWRGYVENNEVSPDPEYYRPFWPEETRTHYQVYETVSEGTPISPPLPSPEAVVEWLTTNPDPLWGIISREAAEALVKYESAPSMMIIPGRGLVSGMEGLADAN